MPLAYRQATVVDIPALMEIRNSVRENALVTLQLGHADYARALTVSGRAWVCQEGERVVGFVCGRPVHGDIWALFLRVSHEGRGIGNALMQIIEEWMFSEGVAEIVLSTEPGTRAERLYQRRGWRFCGPLPTGEVKYALAAPLSGR